MQESLANNTQGARRRANAKAPSLLAGLIVDGAGNKLIATHTVKNGQRYRYYAARPATDGSKVLRLPAREVEQIVVDELARFLRDAHAISSIVVDCGPNDLRKGLKAACVVADEIADDVSAERRNHIAGLVGSVEITEAQVVIRLRRSALVHKLFPAVTETGVEDRELALIVDARLAHRGVETRLVIQGEATANRRIDDALLRAVARGRAWFEELCDGRAKSFTEIANRVGVTPAYVHRMVELAFLAPSAVEAIIEGRQDPTMTVGIMFSDGKFIAWL